MAHRLDAWTEPPDDEQLRRLRRMLLRSACGPTAHVPSADVEDVVQEAMVRFLREPPDSSSPPAEIRASLALRRERANYYRRCDRRPEDPVADPTPLLAGGEGADARFLQALIAIEQIAGRDVRALAEFRHRGYTFDDVAQEAGWSARRVDAARKQLSRYNGRIAAALAIHLKEA
jgi:DNA-directed RNA polymerase specialized sigma24 family protein